MARPVSYDSTRTQHALRALFIGRQLYPARLLVRLQREEGRLQMDFDAAPDAAGRIAVSGPLSRVRGQILDIIGVPKRPAAPVAKPRPMSAQGQIADAVPVDVDSISEPIPAEPADSQE